MKKKFFVFAALILVTAAVVFAQELKFDGYLNSGLGVVANDRDGDDPYFKAFGVDSESNGYRFRLNGAYQNEAKNAGVRFRLQSQRNLTIGSNVPVTVKVPAKDENGNDIEVNATASVSVPRTYGYFSLPYAYGWVGFLENKITLAGGIVDDGTWTTADWWWNDDLAEGLGLLLKAEPIKGLNLGFGTYTITQQTGGSNNILSFGGNLPNFGNVTPKLDQVKYTVNTAYTMPDLFRFGVIFRNKNRTFWSKTDTSISDDAYGYGGYYEPWTLIGELRVLAVKDLTAVVVGVFDYIDNFSKKGNITLSETFGYKLGDINFGLNAVQFIYNREDGNGDKIEYDPRLLFNLWGSYTINNIVPRLDLVYFVGGQSKTASGANQWERRGFAAQAADKKGIKDDDDDYSVFSVRPSVKLNLDSRTFLEIGDWINIDMGNWDGAYGDKGDAKKRSLFTNVFYVDVKFSF
jgi:hypothetical protein